MSNGLILFIYIIVCYGISNIIIYANGPFHIFKKMHEYFADKHPILEEMFRCFICLPTWIGMTMSALNLFLTDIKFTPMNMIFDYSLINIPFIIFFDGMFTSGICWLINNFEEMMERVGNNGE